MLEQVPTTSAKPCPTEALNFLWLEVTGKCNLRCVHCYANSGPQQPLHDYMTPDDWEDVLDQATTLGCRAVQFIGGEPTMYPALPSLIERARDLGFETIEVYTNGTMFKPRLKEVFLRHKVDLAFSVYAANPQTHDLVTKQIGSFDRTLASIRWALAAGLSVRAGIIEMDANAGHTARTQELLRAMGITRVGADRARGIGRGATDHTMETQLGELCGACTRGKLAVTAAGDIFPCVFSRFWPVGHVRQNLCTVVEGIPLRMFRKAMWANQGLRQSSGSERPESCAPGSGKPSDQPEPTCGPDLGSCGPDLGSCVPELPCGPDPHCLPDLHCSPENPPCVSACLPHA